MAWPKRRSAVYLQALHPSYPRDARRRQADEPWHGYSQSELTQIRAIAEEIKRRTGRIESQRALDTAPAVL